MFLEVFDVFKINSKENKVEVNLLNRRKNVK